MSRGVVSRHVVVPGEQTGPEPCVTCSTVLGWVQAVPKLQHCVQEERVSQHVFTPWTCIHIPSNSYKRVGLCDGWSPDLTAAVRGFLPPALSSGESLCGITVAILSLALLFSPKPVLPCTWPLAHNSSSLFYQHLFQRGQGSLTLLGALCCCWDWCWLQSPPAPPHSDHSSDRNQWCVTST